VVYMHGNGVINLSSIGRSI